MPPAKYSVAQAENALIKNYGNVSAAARALGVSHASLFYNIKKKKRLQKARVEARETTLDLAEHGLLKAVRDEKPWAICFMLKCQGKHRGWIEAPPKEKTLEDDIAAALNKLADKLPS